MLLDEVKITVVSGKGGEGHATFRREKYVPHGGPDGGDGGKGGDVVVQVNPQFNTLLDLGYDRIFRAEKGQNGGPQKMTGRCGADCVIGVPAGTLVKDADGNLLADLTEPGQRCVVAKGGRGGLGNVHFKSSTHQTPLYAQPGEPGETKEIGLELKIMADVGLVGLPNAGKSSLVNRISSGRPKVGDYPFTTLEPVLGIVKMRGYGSFVVADIPGLIEGASEGKGLGHRFLKHIERTSALLFVIDGFEEKAWDNYRMLLKELEAFHPLLLQKPRVVAVNKADLGTEETLALFKSKKVDAISTSAVTGEGCQALIDELSKFIRPSAQARGGAW